jgi:AraC family transcriptional regulator
MNFKPQPHARRRVDPVEINSMRTGLLGRVASARGVQVLATHGMPNGAIENRVTTDATVLVYTPRMPADAMISRGRLPFRAVGSLGLIARGHSYTLRGGGPFTCSYCVFGAGFLAGLSETESRLRISELNLVAPIESERLTLLGQEMWREAIAPGFAGALFAEATGLAIAIEIARLDGSCGLDEAPRRGDLAPWQLRRLESYVRAHLSDRLTLRELALLVGVSIRQLSQAIKRSQGVSLHRWIAERRVAEARRLLIETDLPVDEIGRRCAFHSAAAFSAAFRLAAGCTPRAFRRLALVRL